MFPAATIQPGTLIAAVLSKQAVQLAARLGTIRPLGLWLGTRHRPPRVVDAPVFHGRCPTSQTGGAAGNNQPVILMGAQVIGEAIATTLVPIFAVIAIAILTWKWVDGRQKQRMAMIDKGMDPGEAERRIGHPTTALKWGLLLTFLGLGFLIGIILVVNYDAVGAVPPVLGVTFGGIALLLYYRIASRHRGA